MKKVFGIYILFNDQMLKFKNVRIQMNQILTCPIKFPGKTFGRNVSAGEMEKKQKYSSITEFSS